MVEGFSLEDHDRALRLVKTWGATEDRVERVRLCQRIREVGVLPIDQVNHMLITDVFFHADDRTFREQQAEHGARVAEIYRRAGVDVEDEDEMEAWFEAGGELVEELDRIYAQHEEETYRVRAAALRAFGEDELAILLEEDQQEFERRMRRGAKLAGLVSNWTPE